MFKHSLNEADQLPDQWPALRKSERVNRFESLPREQMDNFFLDLDAKSQSELVLALPEGVRCKRLTIPTYSAAGFFGGLRGRGRTKKLRSKSNEAVRRSSGCERIRRERVAAD